MEIIISSSNHWTLYTDGACQPNPGAGGWAFILKNEETKISRRGIIPFTTNNQMEMQAVLEGFKYYLLELDRGSQTLELVSDSKYVIQGITEWCRKWEKNNWTKQDDTPVLNEKMWKEINILKKKINLTCVHVKGHSGHDMNEEVDEMASEAAFCAKKIYST